MCLKSDAPVRVSGRVTGTLGAQPLETQVQAYVSLLDGQTFVAISPLVAAEGQKLQMLQLLAGPIGWLFAVRTDGAPNGYQLTGGKFNHTTTVRFHESDRQITVTQQFIGMNVWDQLEVDVTVDGDLPDVVAGTQIVYPDIVEEFVYAAESTLRSIGTAMLTVNEAELFYSVVQQIEFERCPFAEDEPAFTERPTVFNKVFKVTMAYSPADSALRIGMFNKITLNRDSSACTDGTATCGENTVCMPGGGDLFEVSGWVVGSNRSESINIETRLFLSVVRLHQRLHAVLTGPAQLQRHRRVRRLDGAHLRSECRVHQQSGRLFVSVCRRLCWQRFHVFLSVASVGRHR